MQGANFGLLARHLALTEFDGMAVEEQPGGLLAAGPGGLWSAVWDPLAIGEAEDWVMQAAELAEARQQPWLGSVLFSEPQLESAPANLMLAAALESFGYARRRGMGGGPESVQILGRFASKQMPASLEVATATPDEVETMLASAAAEEDGLLNPLTTAGRRPADSHKLFLARLNGEPVGFAALSGTEIAGRVSSVWVNEEVRGQGIGRELLAAVNKSSGEAGRALLTAWTHRDGRLRYFFNKLGFEDSISAMYFAG